MQHFLKSETGAVTVDWVVLTAGLVGLGLATMAVVSTGVQDTSEDIQDQLETEDLISTSFYEAFEYAAFNEAWMNQYAGFAEDWAAGHHNTEASTRNTQSEAAVTAGTLNQSSAQSELDAYAGILIHARANPGALDDLAFHEAELERITGLYHAQFPDG